MWCPRRDDNHMLHSPLLVGREEDAWMPDEDSRLTTCSYCGSLSEDELFHAIDTGVKLGPTDKTYKVYLDIPNPEPEKLFNVGGRSGIPVKVDGVWTYPNREIFWGTRSKFHAKFYFQHLSDEGWQRFTQIYNMRLMNIGYPGFFYQKPYRWVL